MEDEVLQCVGSMRDEISDTIADLLAADVGLQVVEAVMRTGGDAGVARQCVSRCIEDAQGACTNFSLWADRVLRRLRAGERA